MSRFRIILGVCVLMLLGGYYMLNLNTSANLKANSAGGFMGTNNLLIAVDTENMNATNISSIIVEDIVLGDLNAPVTIIEYASFTCPHCKSFHEDIFKKLKQKYIIKGKVKFILRDVYFDRYGLWAAMLARCDSSNKFYGIVDEIFRKQAEWTKGGKDIDIAKNLRKIGLSVGMDSETIGACLSDGDMAQALVDVYKTNAEKDKISSTPSFLINGEKMKKSTYAEFVEKIDEYLKGY